MVMTCPHCRKLMTEQLRCPYCGKAVVETTVSLRERLDADPELRQMFVGLLRYTLVVPLVLFISGISCVILLNMIS